MTAGGHKKFLFDMDFSPDAEEEAARLAKVEAEAIAKAAAADDIVEDDPEEEIIPTFSEEDVEYARNEGFQAGHTEATRDLTTALEQRLANTMDTINIQVSNLFEAYDRDREEHSRDAVAVAAVIVRKLFPAMNMDKALQEIEHMVIEALQRTSGTPSLVVRVAPEIRDTVQSKADELASLRGHEKAVTVMADESIDEGDAAVEWDGGGMVRDSKLMWQEIDDVIERNLGGERLNGHTAPDNEQDSPQELLQEDAQEVVNSAAVGDNGETATESHHPLETEDPIEATSELPDDSQTEDLKHPSPEMEMDQSVSTAPALETTEEPDLDAIIAEAETMEAFDSFGKDEPEGGPDETQNENGDNPLDAVTDGSEI
ncbi:MAG: FliH/SctL family protein [Magnetovibrio sp.]|nr:FliH/SctL family protein [Magnetovibrio sp.]